MTVPEVRPVAVRFAALEPTLIAVTVPPVTVTAMSTPAPLASATPDSGMAGVATGTFAAPWMISDQVAGQGMVTSAVST